MANKKIIVFDMDGVLVDPTKSYRETVVQTVFGFAGEITLEGIEDYKNRGGWNNDWALTQRILEDQNIHEDMEDVQMAFQFLFDGPDGNGMLEEWLVSDGYFNRLAEKHSLAIFTGRLEADAKRTLDRFAPGVQFSPVICSEHVENGKPAPDGLVAIQKQHPGQELIFLGDTVDDARSARLAGVPFYGVAKADHLRRDELVRLFEEEKAVGILENVNELERFL